MKINVSLDPKKYKNTILPLSMFFSIYCDGIEIKHCVAAYEQDGYCLVYGETELEINKITGDVEIIYEDSLFRRAIEDKFSEEIGSKKEFELKEKYVVLNIEDLAEAFSFGGEEVQEAYNVVMENYKDIRKEKGKKEKKYICINDSWKQEYDIAFKMVKRRVEK